jgi:pimeloyl-ACP methyl ester carboxylesterase
VVEESRRIDRGGRHLAAFVHAGPAGVPTVVCESGLGGDHFGWDRVVAQLNGRVTVVSYDRAGYGASPVADDRRDIAALAADLVAVVQQAAPASAVVLVGHSLGGRIARAAVPSLSPGSVSGVVLLEGAPDGIIADMPDLDRAQRRFIKVMSLVGRTGLLRAGPIKRSLAKRAHYDVDTEGFRSILANVSRASFGRTLLAEWASIADPIPVHDPGVPAIELVAEGWEDWSDKRRRRFKATADDLIAYIEKDFARLYPAGELRRLSGTGHGIERERPDAVAEAVLDLVGNER